MNGYNMVPSFILSLLKIYLGWLEKKKKTKIKSLLNSLDNKPGRTLTWVIQSADGSYAVGLITVNHLKAEAEVHEKSVDVWRILKGKGSFIIGGQLEKKRKIKPNEWLEPSIKGGKKFNVKTGDVVHIPAGTAHCVDAKNGKLEMLIIKINL